MFGKNSRRKKLAARPLPEDWLRIVHSHCPYYARLYEADRAELCGHIQIFLAEKRFEGCAGFKLTDEVRVCIAANACLLLLHRETDYFPDLRTVLVYPDSYFAPFTKSVGHGVLAEGHQSRAGESWPHGAVVLAWAVVQRDLADGGRTNVILHEFAHQLDFEDGYADGAPILGTGENFAARKKRYATWAQVMQTEYDRLRARIAGGNAAGEPSPLRGYGGTNPAEFFAVATESFFGQPRELLACHPELYAELKYYYHQDPAT